MSEYDETHGINRKPAGAAESTGGRFDNRTHPEAPTGLLERGPKGTDTLASLADPDGETYLNVYDLGWEDMAEQVVLSSDEEGVGLDVVVDLSPVDPDDVMPEGAKDDPEDYAQARDLTIRRFIEERYRVEQADGDSPWAYQLHVEERPETTLDEALADVWSNTSFVTMVNERDPGTFGCPSLHSELRDHLSAFDRRADALADESLWDNVYAAQEYLDEEAADGKTRNWGAAQMNPADAARHRARVVEFLDVAEPILEGARAVNPDIEQRDVASSYVQARDNRVEPGFDAATYGAGPAVRLTEIAQRHPAMVPHVNPDKTLRLDDVTFGAQ